MAKASTFHKLVSVYMKEEGLTEAQAYRRVCHEHPDAREAFVDDENDKERRRRQQRRQATRDKHLKAWAKVPDSPYRKGR